MSAAANPAVLRPDPTAAARARSRLKSVDRFGNGLIFGVCAGASVLSTALILLIVYQIVSKASPAISHFGFGFLTSTVWQPNFDHLGAWPLLLGTAVTSATALVFATPLSIAIALFLSLLAPAGVSRVISPLVEMLAAIPSVILGFWGLLVLAPFVRSHMEPWLHGTFGSFLPIFGTPQTTGNSIFTASLVLTIMVVPIIASISRDLFLTVPRDLKDGATALGATRWEMIRGVVLPSTASGVAAATCLGLGRALGEAIAVSQVVGAGLALHTSLFNTGDTLASRIASQFPGDTDLHTASLFYLGVILLVIGLISNLFAQWIGKRFDVSKARTAK
jgi:phosphate transport system permease protein